MKTKKYNLKSKENAIKRSDVRWMPIGQFVYTRCLEIGVSHTYGRGVTQTDEGV